MLLIFFTLKDFKIKNIFWENLFTTLPQQIFSRHCHNKSGLDQGKSFHDIATTNLGWIKENLFTTLPQQIWAGSRKIFSRHCHNKFGLDQGKSQFQCTKFENVIIAGHSNVAAWKTEQL